MILVTPPLSSSFNLLSSLFVQKKAAWAPDMPHAASTALGGSQEDGV